MTGPYDYEDEYDEEDYPEVYLDMPPDAYDEDEERRNEQEDLARHRDAMVDLEWNSIEEEKDEEDYYNDDEENTNWFYDD